MTDYEELDVLLSRLPDSLRRSVRRMESQAIGYAWGFQDGAGESAESAEASRFGTAYAIHAAKYALEASNYRRNIPDSFTTWRATGQITEQEK